MGFSSSTKSCLRKCGEYLKSISAGAYPTGPYYKGQMAYSSYLSGLFTIVGTSLICFLVYRVMAEIRDRTNVQTKDSFGTFDIADHSQTLGRLLNDTQIVFKVKTQNTESLFPESVDCSNFNSTLQFSQQQKGVWPVKMVLNCLNENLGPTFSIVYNSSYESMSLKNDQYFNLYIKFTNHLYDPNTQIILSYEARSSFYDGDQLRYVNFSSNIIPFNFFIETQISPVLYRQVDNLWYFRKPDYQESILYQLENPFAQIPFINVTQQQQKIQLLLRFSKNDQANTPYEIIQITPESYLNGVYKIGGYISLIIGIPKLVLMCYNKWQFQKSLKRNYKKHFKHSLDDTDDEKKFNIAGCQLIRLWGN